MIYRRAAIFLLSAFILGAILLVGCEPWAQFKIVNDTKENLNIFIAATFSDHVDASTERVSVGSVGPGKVLKPEGIIGGFITYLIEARDSQGNIVYSKEFKGQELAKANWKVIISAGQ